jgi:TonB-linked SusC/RagA family outer membrane protein
MLHMKQIKLLFYSLIMLFALPSLVFSQQRTVTGRVTDSTNSPLVDATVSVVGKSINTKTKADGTFTINVPSGPNQLSVSYVGFEIQTVPIISDNLSITMTAATQSLTDVVVVGYGTARRKDLTGSTASVREKDFNKGVFTAPDQLIQGKAAGVLVINNTGQPGGATTVRIRGTSSIRSGNQPLYVVDGVPLSGGSARPGGSGGDFGSDPGNPLAFINPNDIASMEILKDASATAIYGSRGANGVIIITTKRGKTGAPQLDATASTSVSRIIKQLEVLNADEYRQALKDYNIPPDSATGRLRGDFGGSVNAFDAITRTAITQNYNVSMSGGTENGRYRLSVGYLDQKGIIKTSDLKKITANLTSSFRFLESKKLGLDINILVTQTDEQIAPVNSFVGFTGNLISQALQWNPTRPLTKAGTDSAVIDPGSTTINPLAQMQYFDDKAKVNTILASISPSYKITKELEYKFIYSVNRQVGVRRGQVNRLLNAGGIENRGVAFIGNQEQTNTQITNTLNYNHPITSDINLNAVVGHEWLTFASRGNTLIGRDFPNVGLNYYDFLQYSTQSERRISSFASPTTELQSFFGRAIINVKDKYLITGTIRSDGSTRFGENNKYGYFPSVGLAWNASSEDFLKNNAFINNLKVRLSWGKTGNQEFPSGASLNRFGVNVDTRTFQQSNYGNPDLKWETSTTSNAGIDFAILKNRLSGSLDYFYKKTTDVLFEQNIVQPAPGGKIWINLPGYVLNKGFEVMLTANLVRSKDINWNAGVNAAFLQNTVEGLVGYYETGDLRGQGFTAVRGQRLISGQPLNVWYLRRFEGLDKTTGQSTYADQGNTLFYSGSPNPKMLLGLSSDFSYKNFSAAINMNGTFGHYLYNNTAASVLGIGNLGNRNIAKALIGSGIQEAISNAPAPSTRNLEKGNYLKMANATLGYRIGNIGKNFKNVNVTLTGQNLFVITKYTGFDPEVNTDAGFGGIPSLGVEYIPYPSARTFLLGINFSL